MEELVLNKRVNSSKHYARRERKRGKVPGVIYGKKLHSLLFEIGEIELVNGLSKSGEHGVVDFDIDGYSGTAMVKDVQKDPITHKIMHVDLEEISNDKDIVAEVPIKFNGKDFLSQKGVVLQTQKDMVKVSCKADCLPKEFEMNVENARIGSVYKLSDLEVAGEISILDDLSSVCASVSRQQYIPVEDDEDLQ